MTTTPASDPFHTEGKSARLLITAGPTHEPIDDVRYIGNRSSGSLGVALARSGHTLGWPTTLLLGPSCHEPPAGVRTDRYVSTRDLETRLEAELPACDILIMAAAVADFRPKSQPKTGKIRRSETEGLTIELDPTPDLLAGCCRRARVDQLMVGFALEPRDRLIGTARDKLERKGADLIVANPLETMESASIEADLVASPALQQFEQSAGSECSKDAFAAWLLPVLQRAHLTKERIRRSGSA